LLHRENFFIDKNKEINATKDFERKNTRKVPLPLKNDLHGYESLFFLRPFP